MLIRRGDKILVSLNPTIGSEQGKTRPAIVVQNDIGNKYSPTTIVVPLTSNIRNVYPTDVLINESKADCSQIRTIDKMRILKKLGKVKEEEIDLIDKALKISLSI